MPETAPVTLPSGALCLKCRYPLRGLPEHRCPECGSTFDPSDLMTVYLPSWSGWVIRRWIRRPSFVLYAWPLVAGSLLLASKWKGLFLISNYSGSDIVLPQSWGKHFWYVELWNAGIWAWALLLLVWVVRACERRHMAVKYPSLAPRVRREKGVRRFTCACFILAVALGPYRTDRCSHGEFWEWAHVGVAREYPNAVKVMGDDFGSAHAVVWVPLPGRWLVYWRRER